MTETLGGSFAGEVAFVTGLQTASAARPVWPSRARAQAW